MSYSIIRSTKTDKMIWTSINWPVGRPRYEIHVIKKSVSPAEDSKLEFIKLFQRVKSVP